MVLIAAVLVLAFMVHSQSVALKGLQEKLSVPPPAPSLELQGRCAKQAAETFKQQGFGTERFAYFANHYSAKMGRCFIVITNTLASGTGTQTDRNLSDAFEGKEYGSYVWFSSPGKKYWEVPPSSCSVTLPSGEEKKCQSDDEWDNLVKAYMEAN